MFVNLNRAPDHFLGNFIHSPCLCVSVVHNTQILNHGVTQTYLMRNANLAIIFTGSAIIDTMKNCTARYCTKLMRR